MAATTSAKRALALSYETTFPFSYSSERTVPAATCPRLFSSGSPGTKRGATTVGWGNDKTSESLVLRLRFVTTDNDSTADGGPLCHPIITVADREIGFVYTLRKGVICNLGRRRTTNQSLARAQTESPSRHCRRLSVSGWLSHVSNSSR